MRITQRDETTMLTALHTAEQACLTFAMQMRDSKPAQDRLALQFDKQAADAKALAARIEEHGIENDEGTDDAHEPHPLDIAEMQDREDRSAGDPRIEDHAFNPRNGSAGDY